MEKTQKFIVAHVDADEKKVKKRKPREKKRKNNFLTDTVQDKKKMKCLLIILLFKLTPAKLTKILLGKKEILIQIFCQRKMKFKLQIIIPKIKLK